MTTDRAESWYVEPGTVLGSWRIVAPLAQGGMGEVYRAEHNYLPGKLAAVKVMQSRRAQSADFRDRFREEAALLSGIEHPNVVRLHDANVTDEGMAWMAMELLDGRTLDALLDQLGRLDLGDALQILAESADGVHAAHLLGVVHRDIKPANIIVTRKQQVKVLDFGTSKLLDARRERLAKSTEEHKVLGTFVYMSPEQMLGEPPLDYRTDVFSLAVVAYQMLSGRHPLADDEGLPGPEVLAARLLVVDPKPLAGVPPEVWELIRAALAKNRDHRPSMAQLAAHARQLRMRHAGGATPFVALAHVLTNPRAELPSVASSGERSIETARIEPPSSRPSYTTPLPAGAPLSNETPLPGTVPFPETPPRTQLLPEMAPPAMAPPAFVAPPLVPQRAPTPQPFVPARAPAVVAPAQPQVAPPRALPTPQAIAPRVAPASPMAVKVVIGVGSTIITVVALGAIAYRVFGYAEPAPAPVSEPAPVAESAAPSTPVAAEPTTAEAPADEPTSAPREASPAVVSAPVAASPPVASTPKVAPVKGSTLPSRPEPSVKTRGPIFLDMDDPLPKPSASAKPKSNRPM